MAHRVLLSFPTRRSSDLARHGRSKSGSRGFSSTAALTGARRVHAVVGGLPAATPAMRLRRPRRIAGVAAGSSEEHTSELQSPDHLVCRLLLEINYLRRRH